MRSRLLSRNGRLNAWLVLMLILLVSLPAPVSSFRLSEIFNAGTPLSGTKEIKLLAVQESPVGLSGSIANVNLEIRRGTGRVFLDTFPLSQIDTQMSTRFAKEIACKYIQGECSDYDFIYTIRSNSAIIGGPSAGAALSVIAIASLEGLPIRDDVAMTGTINSGGIIGPVSGVRYKIDAAAEAGLSKVLIPEGSMIQDDERGMNYGAEEYGEAIGIEVIEVSDLNDAIYYFTGREVVETDRDIEIPSMYSDTMRSVAEGLCDRNDDLRGTVDEIIDNLDEVEEYSELLDELRNAAISERERAETAMYTNSYYASASHCYGSNINYENMRMLLQREEGEDLVSQIQDLAQEIHSFEDEIDSLDFETLSDFEVYMIMKERIADAKIFVEGARDGFIAEDLIGTYRSLAQASERLFTSRVWKDFLGMGDLRFEIDDNALAMSCTQKLSETQERLRYIQAIAPMQDFSDINANLESAYMDRENEEYALCISRASRAKASANVFMNMVSVRPDDLEILVENKIAAARNVIVGEQEKGNFPIMGYSYYEYADSLKDTDLQSAMIYSEYALELSWLDIYFEEHGTSTFRLPIDLRYPMILAIGFLLGGIVMISLIPRQSKSISSRRIRKRLKRRGIRHR